MIFIFSGFTKITGYAATQGYMESMGVPGMLLPSALLFHQFWIDESQMNPFMKNIAMAGGFLMIFAHGPGAYSIDNSHTRRI